MPAISTTWERKGFSMLVPVSDLVAGENTVEIGTNTTSFALPPNSMHIANIDLEIEVSSARQQPSKAMMTVRY